MERRLWICIIGVGWISSWENEIERKDRGGSSVLFGASQNGNMAGCIVQRRSFSILLPQDEQTYD
jgi:hypothetical protein